MVADGFIASAILGGITWDLIKGSTILAGEKIKEGLTQKGYSISAADSQALAQELQTIEVLALSEERLVTAKILENTKIQEILSRVHLSVSQTDNKVGGDLAAGDIIKSNLSSELAYQDGNIQKTIVQQGNEVTGDMAGGTIIKGNQLH